MKQVIIYQTPVGIVENVSRGETGHTSGGIMRLDPRPSPDHALAILRITVGGFLLFGHGIGKVASFDALKGGFPDPLGLGPEVTLALAALTETVAASALVAGLFTRLAALPLLGTLVVAATLVHTGGFHDRELALVYVVALAVTAVGGPGAFSLDGLLAARRPLGRPARQPV